MKRVGILRAWSPAFVGALMVAIASRYLPFGASVVVGVAAAALCRLIWFFQGGSEN
jgi:hypothetical protein